MTCSLYISKCTRVYIIVRFREPIFSVTPFFHRTNDRKFELSRDFSYATSAGIPSLIHLYIYTFPQLHTMTRSKKTFMPTVKIFLLHRRFTRTNVGRIDFSSLERTKSISLNFYSHSYLQTLNIPIFLYTPAKTIH